MAKSITTPRLSVVMSALNEEGHIKDAVDSILAQTLTDFELIIIDDGSTDKTPAILSHYKDPRMRTVTHKSNQGLVASLNEGVLLARAPLIARHDADDRSEPTRFEKQLKLFESGSDLVLAGTSMRVIDTEGKYLHEHMILLDDPELKQELLVRSPFAHGSVIFKKEVFEKAGGYRQSEWPTEDYGLWIRMSTLGEFANLDEPLYVYRENQAGISINNTIKQEERAERLRRKAWAGRKRLFPKKIQTKRYVGLAMGHSRLERIARNLLFCLAVSIKKGDIITAIRSLRPIFNNSPLSRKCARVILLSLKANNG